MRVGLPKTFSRTLSAMSSSIAVSSLPPKLDIKEGKERPAHHADNKGTRFENPWPSFRYQTKTQWGGFYFSHFFQRPSAPSKAELQAAIPSVKPTWGAEQQNLDKLKATWLGHACYLVEFPAPTGADRGPRVIFDPVFSDRCSPSQLGGPKRLVPPPCKVKDIPQVDAIFISHNHYDHADTPTLSELNELYQPHIYAALNNGDYLKSVGFPEDRIHILDWWDSDLLTLTLPIQGGNVDTSLELTCTPSQHTSNRGLTDRYVSLWSSWAIEQRPLTAEGKGAKVYFGGDTGYKTVRHGEDEEKLPHNPDFAEIGRVFDGFDLALLPIGAYGPRSMWSNLHVSPHDSVHIFQDVRAKRALAMHWGTWILTAEPFLEPPLALAEALRKEGVSETDFEVPGLGETIIYSV